MDIRTANSSTEALHDGEYHDGEYHDLYEMCPSSHDLNFSQDYTGSDTVTCRGKTLGHLCDTGFRSTRPGLKYLVRQWWRRSLSFSGQTDGVILDTAVQDVE